MKINAFERTDFRTHPTPRLFLLENLNHVEQLLPHCVARNKDRLIQKSLKGRARKPLDLSPKPINLRFDHFKTEQLFRTSTPPPPSGPVSFYSSKENPRPLYVILTFSREASCFFRNIFPLQYFGGSRSRQLRVAGNSFSLTPLVRKS